MEINDSRETKKIPLPSLESERESDALLRKTPRIVGNLFQDVSEQNPLADIANNVGNILTQTSRHTVDYPESNETVKILSRWENEYPKDSEEYKKVMNLAVVKEEQGTGLLLIDKGLVVKLSAINQASYRGIRLKQRDYHTLFNYETAKLVAQERGFIFPSLEQLETIFNAIPGGVDHILEIIELPLIGSWLSYGQPQDYGEASHIWASPEIDNPNSARAHSLCLRLGASKVELVERRKGDSCTLLPLLRVD